VKKISSYFSSLVPPHSKKLDDNASQTYNTENPLVYSGEKSKLMLWLSVQNKKFGCMVCKSTGSLGVEST
jgi:hypothetical protein